MGLILEAAFHARPPSAVCGKIVLVADNTLVRLHEIVLHRGFCLCL
jgi:hypothetical protein